RPFFEAEQRELRRVLACGARFLQPLHPQTRRAVLTDADFQVLHRPQDDGPVPRAGFVLARLRRIYVRLHASQAEQRPADRRSDTERLQLALPSWGSRPAWS